MKKATLIGLLFLSACTQKTRTITEHEPGTLIGDSARSVTLVAKISYLQTSAYFINTQLIKIKSKKLDSIELVRACDTIAMGANIVFSQIKPLKDTVYTDN